MGLSQQSCHTITPINFLGDLPPDFNLNRFDGLIIHYSLIACHFNYIAPPVRDAIAAFKGLKIAFVQDDYRFIDDTVGALAYMKIHILFGLAGPDIIDDVYSPEKLPGVRRETVLAGYVPEHLLGRPVPDFVSRDIDVGYRARKLSAWIGSHGQEKWIIADRFLRDAPAYGLKCDISCREEDRIYGDAWIGFLTNCKAVLGTESGAGVCDFTGKIQAAVEAHEARDPNVSYETLRELYFKEEDGRLMMNVISPRCFEAAALRTLMILYEGDYSGRMEAGRHYLSLRRDHSNMDEIVAVLRDPARAQEIIDTAYDEVANNPANWFRAMVEQVDTAINETVTPDMLSSLRPYSQRELKRLITVSNLRKNIVADTVRVVVQGLNFTLKILPEKQRNAVHDTLRSYYWMFSTMRRMARRSGLAAVLAPEIRPALYKIAHQNVPTNCEFVWATHIRQRLSKNGQARMHLMVDGDRLHVTADTTGPGMLDRLALCEVLPRITSIDWHMDSESQNVHEFPNIALTGRTDPELVADFLVWLSEGSK